MLGIGATYLGESIPLYPYPIEAEQMPRVLFPTIAPRTGSQFLSHFRLINQFRGMFFLNTLMKLELG